MWGYMSTAPDLYSTLAVLSLQVVKERATHTAQTWMHCQRGTGSAGCAWRIVTASWQARSLLTLQVFTTYVHVFTTLHVHVMYGKCWYMLLVYTYVYLQLLVFCVSAVVQC